MGDLLICTISLLLLVLSTSAIQQLSIDRIVGGASINVTDIPFILSFRANDSHICGASIINENWGVTAAHCVQPIMSRRTQKSVRSGSSKRESGGTIHNVTKIIYNHNYDDENLDYDIAVFKVDPPFEFNNATQPVKLPEDPKLYKTNWGLVAGWGYFITKDPVLSEDLQYVILPRVKRQTCIDDYEDYNLEITKHQICYGFEEAGEDACKGDSGGPLVNNSTLIGITSWGASCAKPNAPGVYTDVTILMDWIKSKIKS
ncbi:unnamed protein product [Xylocopa violacea]|uniref:Peptidase S1 domain-containing protein n=1 Tax=Xylocopa violacea TaxID=135666 RepID=A0ABP1NB97_XYLVO